MMMMIIKRWGTDDEQVSLDLIQGLVVLSDRF